MKTYLLSILLLAGIYSLQAQPNNYLQDTPVWAIHSVCSDASSACIKYEDYNYYTNGDTLINSLLYKKIYKKGQGYYAWGGPGFPPCPSIGNFAHVDPEPFFFLRSANKQMFICEPSNSTEQLLYDFNLSVGSTLPLSYNNSDNAITVSSIDSIYTPYGYRKRFALSGNTWAQYLIEGVGHSRGLIEPMHAPLECGFNLTCYSLNNSAYYPTTGTGCNINVGITKQEKVRGYNLYPNPFNDYTDITFPAILAEGNLSIYSMYGQEINTIYFTETNSVRLQKADMKPGIYFIELNTEKKRSSLGKIIITE